MITSSAVSPIGMTAFYRYEKEPEVLERYKILIDFKNGGPRERREVTGEFQPEEAIIITYNSTDILLQMAIVSDGKQTYLILSYKKANQLVTASYSDLKCAGGLLLSEVNATHTSNIGQPGIHVFSLSSFCDRVVSSIGKNDLISVYFCM